MAVHFLFPVPNKAEKSLDVGITDALKVNFGIAKVLTICILPKRERLLHFHRLIDFFKYFLKFP